MDLRSKFFLFLALEILCLIGVFFLPPLAIFNNAWLLVILIPIVFSFVFSGTELSNQALLYQFIISTGLGVWGIASCSFGNHSCESMGPIILPFLVFIPCVIAWAIGRTIWKGSIWPKKRN
jgi:MFS-type transporter involved in bile tolerance (Atg22 family)